MLCSLLRPQCDVRLRIRMTHHSEMKVSPPPLLLGHPVFYYDRESSPTYPLSIASVVTLAYTLQQDRTLKNNQDNLYPAIMPRQGFGDFLNSASPGRGRGRGRGGGRGRGRGGFDSSGRGRGGRTGRGGHFGADYSNVALDYASVNSKQYNRFERAWD